MDHGTIEESGLVERYLLGQLTLEEKEEFEDHYLDCAECLERLELTRRMRDGMARVVLEDTAGASAARQLGVLALLARLARSPRGGLLATAFLVAALAPAGWMWRQMTHLDRDLAATRAALEASRRNTPPPATEELDAARKALDLERAQRAEERERERRERERLASELAAARPLPAPTSVVQLSPERSSPGEGEPSTRITLSPSPSSTVLVLDLPPLDDEGPFRAILRRGGRKVWEGEGLAPDPAGAIAVSFPAGSLEPGDHVLELETASGPAGAVSLASFRFRVQRER